MSLIEEMEKIEKIVRQKLSSYRKDYKDKLDFNLKLLGAFIEKPISRVPFLIPLFKIVILNLTVLFTKFLSGKEILKISKYVAG